MQVAASFSTVLTKSEGQAVIEFVSSLLRTTVPNLLFFSIFFKLGTKLLTSLPEYSPFIKALFKAEGKRPGFACMIRKM